MMENFEKQQTVEELNDQMIIKMKIKSRKVTIQSYGLKVERIKMMKNYFEKCIRKMRKVPNIVFFMTLHDKANLYYRNNRKFKDIPILTYAVKKKEYFDVPPYILIPDFDIASESTQERVIKVYEESKKTDWKNKEEIAIWRGASTGEYIFRNDTIESVLTQPRFNLVHLSKKNPHILDAKFSSFVQFENQSMIPHFIQYFGQPESRTEFDLVRYKYLVSVDGNTATW